MSSPLSPDTDDFGLPVRLLGPPWGDTSRVGVPYAKDPSVVRFQGRYLLYYSLPPAQGIDSEPGWAIGVATSDDLVDWTTVATLGPFGEYDRRGRAAPGAAVIHGRVHLFYQTYGQGAGDSICHATSTDGVTFEPNADNPVFAPTGSWNCGRAIDADVVVADDRVLLAWATRDPSMTIQMVGTASAPVSSAFERADWTDHSVDRPALAPTLDWELDCIEAPALVWDGARFGMFYAGGYNNAPQQIGWATSDDGVQWIRGYLDPLIPHGEPGTWNSSESGHPGVFTDDDDQTYLFFQGNDDDGASWRIAGTRVSWTADGPDVERQSPSTLNLGTDHFDPVHTPASAAKDHDDPA